VTIAVHEMRCWTTVPGRFLRGILMYNALSDSILPPGDIWTPAVPPTVLPIITMPMGIIAGHGSMTTAAGINILTVQHLITRRAGNADQLVRPSGDRRASCRERV
jgi:hypothetical protein